MLVKAALKRYSVFMNLLIRELNWSKIRIMWLFQVFYYVNVKLDK